MNNLDTVSLFNHEDTFLKGTAYVDNLIDSGKYYRGYLFKDTIKKNVIPGGTILDYGCAQGRISKMIAEEGFKVMGVDPASKLIEQAVRQDKKNLELNFSVITGNGEFLEKESFDAILCSSVIEFVPEYEILLSNFYRALKPNGKLIISFANKKSYFRIKNEKTNKLKQGFLKIQQNTWSSEEFLKALKKSKFIIMQKTIFFESAFDNKSVLKFLSSLQIFGTLGLVVAQKK